MIATTIVSAVTAFASLIASGTAFASSVAFTIGALTITWGAVINTALIFGGVALSMMTGRRGGYSSPTYDGIKQTQTNQDLPVPLLYGTCKLAGNRIWQDEEATTHVKRIVAFAEGEICGFDDIKLNDIPVNEISGITVNKYYGTDDQTVDPIVGGETQEERIEKVGGLKKLAYLAITVPRTSKIDVNYNLTAVVKGRKVRVYTTTKHYTVEYSENPAWVMFDFLTSYNGLGLGLNSDGTTNDNLIKELFDLESFIESAAFCDELIDGSPRFTFNMIFDSQTSARNLIDEIYRSCRGGLFTKNGKLQFKIDKPEAVSKIFHAHDIVKGSETFSTLPAEDHYDILKCIYVSPEHEWQKVEAFAEIPEYKTGVPVEHTVNIYSVTNFKQASRLAWYYVNSKVLQPYFGSFKTDYRAYDVEVGDVIQFDSLLMGLESYAAKVTSVTDDGAGTFTINWRTYDERLYDDTLGSKEPYVLVSNLKDMYDFPEDVEGFNVVQSNNLFNYVWKPTSNKSDRFEIRCGESWESGEVYAKNIAATSASAPIRSKGLFKFWIKAFNGYNYSKNATLDVIYIDSLPELNTVVSLDILADMQGVLSNTLKTYNGTLKLKVNNVLWNTTEDFWGKGDMYYQSSGLWGARCFTHGTYLSQVYDIGAVLESIVSSSVKYQTADEQANVVLEWAYSSDGETYSDWAIVNTGTYTFRYCKFRITINSPNGEQVVVSDCVANVDVPDKEINLQLEITDKNGLTIEYDFLAPPSIVATVNDNNDAYVVVTEKTNTYAKIKAYTNAGNLCTCKVSLRAKGY